MGRPEDMQSWPAEAVIFEYKDTEDRAIVHMLNCATNRLTSCKICRRICLSRLSEPIHRKALCGTGFQTTFIFVQYYITEDRTSVSSGIRVVREQNKGGINDMVYLCSSTISKFPKEIVYDMNPEKKSVKREISSFQFGILGRKPMQRYQVPSGL